MGPTFEDHPHVFSQKGPAPWNLFLTPAPRPLQVTWSVGEAEHMWLQPFARTNVFSAKHVFCILGARSGQMYPFARTNVSLEFVPDV